MTTDPTPLAEQIAREHAPHIEWEVAGLGIAWRGCSCGERVSRTDHRAHIATVTERVVRERDAEALARFTQDDGVARLVVTDLRDLRPGDFIMHPTVDGLAVARGWQYKFEADHEHAVRARVAAEIESRVPRNIGGHPYSDEGRAMSRAARIARGATDA